MVLRTLRYRLCQSSAIVVGTLMGAQFLSVPVAHAVCPGTIVNGETQVVTQVLANGENCTVDAGGAITTVGVDGITGADNNTITNSGSISTTDNFAEGIDSQNNNTISNSGSISTTGNYSYGISGNDNNTISNTGSISTTGNDASGIYGDDFNTISNSGSISTTGTDAYGIYGDDFNTISNSGSISTTGDGAYGISGYGNNTITNSGSISTTGFNAEGIDAEDNNTVINTGTITTSGFSGDGIDLNNNSTVTNSGSISTSGVSANGIEVDDDSTVTNSGLVVSVQANSFQFLNNNTLNLLAPSFIGGVIDLGTNTTVNITTGPSHSVLWDFSTGTMTGGMPGIGGTVPFFYNAATQQFATFDPTAFAAAPDALAEKSGALSNVMQQRLEAGSAACRSASPDTDPDANDNINCTGGPMAWVSAFGGRSDYDGNRATNDRNLSQGGVAAGFDWSPSGDLSFGILGGYMEGTLDADSRFSNAFNNSSSGFFGGLYGRGAMGGAFFDFALTGGMSDYSDRRFVNDNLAPLGVSYAKGSYDGYWVSPEVAAGVHFNGGKGVLISPTARLRYASQWLDGFSEAGPSAANAVVGSRQVAIGEASLELAASKITELASTTLRIGYLYRTSLGDSSTGVTMIGQRVSIPGFDEDRQAVYVGANSNINLTDTLSVELGGRVLVGQDFTGYGGNVKLVSKF